MQRCTKCNSDASEPLVAFGSILRHAACFTCDNCQKSLLQQEFYDQEGKPFCSDCNNQLFSHKCFRCNLSIIEKAVVFSSDQKYHPKCFSCTRCDTNLVKTKFCRRQHKPYCMQCATILDELEAELPICPQCNERLEGGCEIIEWKYEKYHSHHFTCGICKIQLHNDMKEFKGKFYCPKDYKFATAPTCDVCKELVLESAIQAFDKYYHAEHFTCTKCNVKLDGTFHDYKSEPYCELHYFEIIGGICGFCYEPIKEASVNALGKRWHLNHLRCQGCFKDVAKKKFTQVDNAPWCKSCYNKFPIDVRIKLTKYQKIESKTKQ